MDEFQHALFFKANDLTDKDMVKIRRYFQKRRESGGGECGLIEKTAEKTYKICFKEKEDQESVLKRESHTISLPNGELCLTVSQSSSLKQVSPQNPNELSTQSFTKTNTKGLEKIFRLDVYLLYYLRDNPDAYKVLEKQLSAIGCSVDLDLVEEEAVVRGDVEKGRGSQTAEKWEIQVDRVMIGLTESYVCHHVLDPEQIRVLRQDSSFATDDISIYKDCGYCVVVGEVGAVNERIAKLEKSAPISKCIPIVEKKFKLVEEEFTREMRVKYPEVKILISDGIILEGPDKDVQSGAKKLDELINKIKEKRVRLHTELTNFIKSSGAISKYQARFQQSLRNPVSMEVASDLVLSSLSSGALDEAEAAVQRDLRVDTVQLQDAANLNQVKEILNQAKNEENRQGVRVKINLIPGMSGTAVMKVQLVGYSENVNKLKEVLHNYQADHVGTQEVMDLSAELVDCFDKILDLTGMTQTDVTLKASHFPHPCVVVSGPRRLVREAQENLKSALADLISDTLVLDGSGAQRFFQAEGKMNMELVERACKVIIREQQSVNSPNVTTKPRSISSPSTVRYTSTPPQTPTTSLQIKLGSLEDEQVNVLVVPMLNKKLTSTNIGKCLLAKAGDAITRNFDLMAANCTINPGDVLQVDGPPSLGCSKIFFIECLPWDGVRGLSVQALGNGLQRCLDLCVQQGRCSVAFPVIGPGVVLKYPPREAIDVLTENIRQFGSSASSGSLSTIHVVIKPIHSNAKECYHDVYRLLSLNINQGGQGIFRSVTSDLDEITINVGGGVKLQLVFGDITNETTGAIVNTTDFVNFNQDGVCKDILTVAGPEIEAELKGAQMKKGQVFVTHSGSFPCETILHVCGERDVSVINQLVLDIIKHCEAFGLKSVAIPAICTGAGAMDPGVVAGAILQGIKVATSTTSLSCLTNVRLILFKISVFMAFKEEVMQVFAASVINRASGTRLSHVQLQQPQPAFANADLSVFHTSSTDQQSVFFLLGLSREDVNAAKTKLRDLYRAQCSTQTFTKEQLEDVTQDDINDLKLLVETQGLYMQRDQSGHGSLTVSGLKDGVSEVMQMVNGFMQRSHVREVRVREEEDLYLRVVWCIQGHHGNWERLPKTANYNLENNDILGGIVDAQGLSWSVDLQAMETRRRQTGQKAKLKRLENHSDFTLPLYWDNMDADSMTQVALQSSSAEYQTVKEAFKRTVGKTVMKIERVQNIHLRRGYEALKKQICDKNKLEGGAGEKLLYHGTTQENCSSIMKTGFNRSFAGQNATSYGQGTYFAVNAKYSANSRYSKRADDGTQLMFMARVLTGICTVGSSDMRVPPLRNVQQPDNRYDSLVDRLDNPSLYVVFHDSQAYPDYLITFI